MKTAATPPVPPSPGRGVTGEISGLILAGGPSHVDMFDPKPELQKMAGKPLPQ